VIIKTPNKTAKSRHRPNYFLRLWTTYPGVYPSPCRQVRGSRSTGGSQGGSPAAGCHAGCHANDLPRGLPRENWRGL